MDSCPKELEPFDKAHAQKLSEKDMLVHSWIGNYGISALVVAIDHCFNKKAKTNYIKEPILRKQLQEIQMTQEELDNRELERMLLAEEMWIKNDRKRGLSDTIIK